MIRKNFYLTEEQSKALGQLNGLTVSEHIRRAIDEYIESRKPQVSKSPSKKGGQHEKTNDKSSN